MKTNLIEIFQTIRAAIQPYATLGFTNRVNSEQEYDLWAETKAVYQGEERTEFFFADLRIEEDHVAFTLLPDELPEHEKTMLIKELDDVTLNLIEDKVAAGYKIFKEQEWV